MRHQATGSRQLATGNWQEGTRRAKRGTVAVFAALTLALPAALAAQFESGIAVGTKAPVIAVHDLDGKSVDLGAYLGKKPVLIQFWASWCPVCKGLLPKLEAVEREFGAGVVKIGINITVNDSKEKARRYLERHRPPFLALYDDQGVSARAYEVPTTGFIVLVDGSGKVAYTGVGEDQDLVAAVRKVVSK